MVKNSNRLKQKKYVNDDVNNIRNLIIILIIVIGICVGLYFLTEYMVSKEEKVNPDNKSVDINYDIATIGTMFNRIENDYYVVLYSSEESGSELDSVLTTYRSSDAYIKTYYVDLDLKVNNSALGDSLEKKPSNSKEVLVNGPTLYEIKNGKVVKCYIGVEEITKIFKNE